MVALLYITAPTLDKAKAIARALLDERLIACANISSPITSLYRWEGILREESEVVLMVKTTRKNMEKAIARVKALHEYDCPCIVALDVAGGYEPFLDWIAAETMP